MTESRDKLFGSIHSEWLKPLGFRKVGRKSTRELGPGVSIQVLLESYPATPYGPFRFSIDVIARWQEVDQPAVTHRLSLPGYATKEQFWIFSDESTFEVAAQELRHLFERVAVPAIQKMASLDGLLELFKNIPTHVGLIWYYGSYFNLLKRLGRVQDQRELLQRVIESVPREDIVEKARQLMVQLEAPTR